ncbi:UNVERIFIED_CONTAM: hypothetical protein Sindi_2672700, partial [Sesamum indicum]
ARTQKSVPIVLIGEAPTSKAKGKRDECWKRKKGKGKVFVVTISAPTAIIALIDKGKGKGKNG